MLFSLKKSALLVVDVQEKLLPAIHEQQAVLERCAWLCRLAQILNMPTVVSEHCVDKIGGTHPVIREAAPQAQYIQKKAFSAAAEKRLRGTAIEEAKRVIVCGIEAHVCVWQTVYDLRAEGKAVWVVADAISSRSARDVALACERMKNAGAHIVSAEMVAFEALRTTRHPQFSVILKELIR